MSRLAKQYQLSDVGLAKICKKMQIPVPGRGYWAKVQNGAKPPIRPLGKAKKNCRELVKLDFMQNVPEVSAEKLQLQVLQQEFADLEITSLHPLVEITQKRVASAKN